MNEKQKLEFERRAQEIGFFPARAEHFAAAEQAAPKKQAAAAKRRAPKRKP